MIDTEGNPSDDDFRELAEGCDLMVIPAEEMLVGEKFPIFASEIPRLAAFEKAAAGGVPVYAIKDDRAAPGWGAYESAGKEIING